ncbi:Polypeptide N-acetylgalactosaminyltransferase 16 [Takifugu flavidus]|uniref:Polypeptide N-acetylgalactosaminyltransferase 16 n=1 Tax=Takifugu flavidus TaxID=433684 RepID=A0A5C6P0F5_9TELE|nr:Polypeptide N-acetylgalactosaminyltransferase 16 [Takifugu flavidus]
MFSPGSRQNEVTQLPRAEQQGKLLGSFDEKDYLSRKLLKPGDDPYRDHAFNVQESDRLGGERAIRDTRHYRCASMSYDAELPSTSIIITFHNEARSTLLRTVKSVLMRSPPSLVQEIILIDDFSSDREFLLCCCSFTGSSGMFFWTLLLLPLVKDLQPTTSLFGFFNCRPVGTFSAPNASTSDGCDVVASSSADEAEDCQLLAQIPKVRCLRNVRREGLIRSRVRGANAASASILTFLDSHCEVNTDWLQPMIQRVKEVE